MRETEPADPREEAPLVGRVIDGKYRLLDLIARGGMGSVWRAQQLSIGRHVAVKMLRFDGNAPDDDTFRERFFLEASTLGRLRHPNTVVVFDYGHFEEEQTLYMVMEFVDGRTLSQVVHDDGPLQPRRALRIADEIARALSEAHQLGIVHRDLKPQNVMLVREDDGRDRVKVLDFGIAKVIERDGESLTRASDMLGSPKYMAPEQVRQGKIDPRTDLYSLGAVVYYALTGKEPFAEDTPIRTLMAQLNDPVPDMKARSGVDVPQPVEAIVRRCLEKDPKARFADVAAFRRALRVAIRPAPVRASNTFDTLTSPPEGLESALAAAESRSPAKLARTWGPVALAAAVLLVGAVWAITTFVARAPAEPITPAAQAP